VDWKTITEFRQEGVTRKDPETGEIMFETDEGEDAFEESSSDVMAVMESWLEKPESVGRRVRFSIKIEALNGEE